MAGLTAMRTAPALALALAALVCATGARAEDELPLLQGSYASVNSSCKDAAPADTMTYSGGNKAPNPPQIDCTIQQLSKSGNTYTLSNICTQPASGQRFPLNYTLVVRSAQAFAINGHAFKYCGQRFQF